MALLKARGLGRKLPFAIQGRVVMWRGGERFGIAQDCSSKEAVGTGCVMTGVQQEKKKKVRGTRNRGGGRMSCLLIKRFGCTQRKVH